MKLNLGSHDRVIPGYDNMDFGDYPGLKYKGDVSDLSQFHDDSIEVIRASHILEHFAPKRTEAILREWRRALKPDGLLYLSVPNWEILVEIYLKDGLGEWIINMLYGDQGYDGAEHKTVFDERRLTMYLKKAGFTDVSIVEELPDTPTGECSLLRSTLDTKLISLNVIAVKG